MTDPHASTQRDEILRRVVVGELAPNHAEVRRMCELDESFAAELEQCLGVQRLLDTDASDEREARVRKQRSRRFWFTLGALAAALLVMFFVGRLQGEAGVTPETRAVQLGSGSLVLDELQPAGPSQSFRSFRFSAKLPAGAHSEIRIWAADAPDDAEPLVKQAFSGTSWSPTDEELGALPDRIRWELRVLDVQGEPLGIARVASASR